MLFNSFVFLGFFAVVLAAYWLLRRRRYQNLFLVGASLFFYAWGEPILVVLIVVCAATGYLCGLAVERSPDRGRVYVAAGSAVALGILFVFKYFNFFVESLGSLFDRVGLPFQETTLRLALPIGISFFTFQTVGYMIDVYRGHARAERNIVDFFLFVTFFPQLVAGPIERATNLLPQVKRERTVDGDDLVYGTYMVLQGYVKKVVVADNLGPIIDTLFGFDNLSGPLVFVGILAFAFQIYCDFSGYTDIARGVARLMGFRILLNFNHPYISRSPTEFWRRWHITLSHWFRDYVYIPLGGNQRTVPRTYVNVFITMVVSGLWHGASANFIVWGAYWGAAVLAHKYWVTLTARFRHRRSGTYGLVAWGGTFLIALYGWLLFRVEEWDLIVGYTQALFGDWSMGSLAVVVLGQVLPYIVLVVVMDAIESRLILIPESRAPFRWVLSPYYALLLLIIVVFGSTSGGAFIYFRF